jgi:hypothetical protein
MLTFVLSLALVFLLGMFIGWMVHDIHVTGSKGADRLEGSTATWRTPD